MRSRRLYFATRSSGRRAGLDLPGAGGYRQVCDCRVLGLAGAVRYHGGVAGVSRNLDRLERSVRVPIWLTLIRIELATPISIPRRRRSGLVTKRSSPTSWQRSPIFSVRAFQPSQSSSSMPSSIETTGKRARMSCQ